MATDVDICARAMVLLGLEPISSLEGDGAKERVCNTLWPMVKDQILTSYPWRITMKKVQLAKTLNTPDNDFSYEFQLPTDRIAAPRAVYNTSSTDIDPITDFDIFGDKLYANDTTIWIDYQIDVAETSFPPYVITLCSYALAASAAESLTDDTSKARLWNETAFGPPSLGGTGGYYQTARYLDARTTPPDALSAANFELVTVRNS